MISKCGVICQKDCKAWQTECQGCNELSGKVSWAVFYSKEYCPIYECVLQKALSNCGECGQAPCQIWKDTRNPDASDEEFTVDINSRLKNLKENER